jgi:hypothetical protein
VEKGGLKAALNAAGLVKGQRILFVDEMRIGLWGQVRRVWGIRGIRVVQKVQIVFAWSYLVLGVNTQSGELRWDWIDRVRQEFLVPVLESWPVDGLIWDNASSHKGKRVAALGHKLVFLPPYSPELDPVERIFEVLRAKVEGVVYPSLQAKQLAIEHHLRQLAAGRQQVKRLANWQWIQEAFENLPEPEDVGLTIRSPATLFDASK